MSEQGKPMGQEAGGTSNAHDKPCSAGESETLATAREWARGFVPDASADYSQVAEYAAARYEELAALFSHLDEKADALIRYGSAGVAFLSALAAVLSQGSGQLPQSPWVSVPAALAVLLLVGASAVAIVARRPVSAHVPGQAKQFIEALSDPRIVSASQVGGLVAAAHYCAAVGLVNAIADKGNLLTTATVLLVLGLVGIAIGGAALCILAVGA